MAKIVVITGAVSSFVDKAAGGGENRGASLYGLKRQRKK
jgi:hypothetical protein